MGGGSEGVGGDGGWHQHDVSLKYRAHDESMLSLNSSVHELDSWHVLVLAWNSYAMQLQSASHRASHAARSSTVEIPSSLRPGQPWPATSP